VWQDEEFLNVTTGGSHSYIYIYIYNTPIHSIQSTAPQLSISQKALGTLPEDDNVMPKHVGATIHNLKN
jgi:hypothetical protein